MFLGAFLSLDTSIAATTLDTDMTSSIVIENGIYDDLFVDMNTDLEYSTTIPKWDYTTVMYARFRNNLLAGNVDFTLATISELILKKREYGSYNWTTIFSKTIKSEEDLDFFYNDIVVASNTRYQYAAVPVLGGAEGEYQVTNVDVSFDGCFIIDPTNGYKLIANLTRSSLSRNNPANIIEPINSKYPYVNYYSQSQYDSFTISGLFAPFNPNTCEFDSQNGWKYRKKVRDFLTNRRSKIVKLYDGQIYMASVVDAIQESIDGHPENVNMTINFVEVGDVNNGSDLYYHGFTDFLEAGV